MEESSYLARKKPATGYNSGEKPPSPKKSPQFERSSSGEIGTR